MEFPRDQDARQELMYRTHLRTNELLEQLIQLQTKPMVIEPIKTPVNRGQQAKNTTTRGERQ